ncbi:MAG: hypothetical protein Q9N34_03570 [Aquificota bacterium]|nr:hypothetical protein [Aquificota bacterium]
MERTRDKKENRVLPAFLFSVWIGFMAVAGFFVPSFFVQPAPLPDKGGGS